MLQQPWGEADGSELAVYFSRDFLPVLRSFMDRSHYEQWTDFETDFFRILVAPRTFFLWSPSLIVRE